MNHYLRPAGLAAMVSLISALSCSGQVVWSGSLAVTADAFVTTGPTNNLANSNYGGAGALAISGSGATRSGVFKGLFESVIRFDLSGAKSTFDAAYGAGLWSTQSVTLRLATTSPNNPIFNDNSSGQFEIAWLQNDSGAEGNGMPNSPGATGLTYNSLHAPPPNNLLGPDDQSAGIFNFDALVGGADGFLSTYTLIAGSGLQGDISSGSLASLYFSAETNSVSYLFNSRSFGTPSRQPLLTITAVPEPTIISQLGLVIGGALATRTRRRES